MIVSRGRAYIFVHIPKTGGTAMALALEARAKADDIMIGDTPKAVKRRGKVKGIQTAGRLWKHSTLADAEGLITRDEMAQLFTFTLVRNPWDRMVSYYHWLKTQTFDHPAADLYIRLEHLAQDIAPLEAHLGFALDMQIANASARPRDWRGFYTESDAELLGELCATDVKTHRYTFDPA